MKPPFSVAVRHSGPTVSTDELVDNYTENKEEESLNDATAQVYPQPQADLHPKQKLTTTEWEEGVPHCVPDP